MRAESEDHLRSVLYCARGLAVMVLYLEATQEVTARDIDELRSRFDDLNQLLFSSPA